MNVATFRNAADVAPGAIIRADGLTLSATVTPVSDDGSTDCAAEGTDCINSIEAAAISATSGGSELGVAGSVAINIVSGTTSAQLKSSNSIVSTVDAGAGDVSLAASNDVDETTSATPYRDAFDPADSIIADDDGNLTIIVLPYALADGNLQAGDAVVYHSSGGDPIGVVTSDPKVLPAVLVENQHYYVIPVRPGYIKLAASYSQAIAHDALVLIPTQATGDSHYLVPEGDGAKMGIGASFALGIDTITTTAAIQDGVVLTGGHDLSIIADDSNAATTTAVNGSAGSVAFAPAVALTIANLVTTASIGSGAAIEVTGDVEVEAVQAAATETASSGDVDAEKAGVALAIALALVDDTVATTVSRSIHADGPVTITAKGSSSNGSESEAAAPGAPTERIGGVNAIADRVLGQGSVVSKRTPARTPARPKRRPPAPATTGAVAVSRRCRHHQHRLDNLQGRFGRRAHDHLRQRSPNVASSANTDASAWATAAPAVVAGVGIGAGVAVNDVTMTNIATTGASDCRPRDPLRRGTRRSAPTMTRSKRKKPDEPEEIPRLRTPSRRQRWPAPATPRRSASQVHS